MLLPTRTVAPAIDLLSLAEVKTHLNVTFSDDDTLITFYRDAVTQYLDGFSGYLGRCLLTQTWRLDLDAFPGDDKLRLPFRPVTAVSGITYYDASNVSQTLATAVYAGPFTDALSAYVVLKFGQSWPVTYAREDAVAVTFVAGAATAASNVPAPIRAAALLMIGDLYAQRETFVIGVTAEQIPMSPTVEALLAPFRVSWA